MSGLSRSMRFSPDYLRRDMVSAQQVTGQQTEVVPYQGVTVISQGFLEMMSIIPIMMIMFFFMMMMGLMRDIAREPGAAKEIVVRGVEVGKKVVGGIAGAVKGGE